MFDAIKDRGAPRCEKGGAVIRANIADCEVRTRRGLQRADGDVRPEWILEFGPTP
jgi:hypothetical protein